MEKNRNLTFSSGKLGVGGGKIYDHFDNRQRGLIKGNFF
jgi:hypothetical protein